MFMYVCRRESRLEVHLGVSGLLLILIYCYLKGALTEVVRDGPGPLYVETGLVLWLGPCTLFGSSRAPICLIKKCITK